MTCFCTMVTAPIKLSQACHNNEMPLPSFYMGDTSENVIYNQSFNLYLYVPSLQNARCREKSTLTVLTLVFLAPVPVRNPPKSAP